MIIGTIEYDEFNLSEAISIVDKNPEYKKISLDFIIKEASKLIESDININLNLEDNGFDELDFVKLIMAIEKEYNIYIADCNVGIFDPYYFKFIERDIKINSLIS